ncbi:MAG: hypothetical protein U1D30_17325 [Planctomycetota bacterium]
MQVTQTTVKSILTRTGGFLKGVVSHSLQPYRGCSFGNSLCGVGCYVQHNRYVTEGRPWGSFLEVRTNAAEVYRLQFARERKWAKTRGGGFGIFLSSSTDPFVPQESQFGITRALLESMCDLPPDRLILQTHTHAAVNAIDIVVELSRRCDLRLHLSIETDRARLEGLPPPASPVDRRFETAKQFRSLGIRTVITVAPLLPLDNPMRFFERVRECADAVVIDHFIGGDGTATGSRTQKTPLPILMNQIHEGSATLDYRDEVVRVAAQVMPGRVGVGSAGFAGEYAY